MKEHGANGLDAMIDSAGGDILGQTVRLLNNGAKVVCYGMYVPGLPAFSNRNEPSTKILN